MKTLSEQLSLRQSSEKIKKKKTTTNKAMHTRGAASGAALAFLHHRAANASNEVETDGVDGS